MAQHDQVIERAPGIDFRADINAALAALFSSSSGPAEPAVIVPGQWWFDTGTPGLTAIRYRNAANNAWIELALLGSGTTLQGLLDAKQPASPVLNDLANLGPLLLAHDLLMGGGASDLIRFPSGTPGQQLSIDGSGNIVWRSPPATVQRIWKLITTSGAYARSAGTTHANILAVGLGGGGGNANAPPSGIWTHGSGGSSGAVLRLLNVEMPATATITIPAVTNGDAPDLTLTSSTLNFTVPGGFKGVTSGNAPPGPSGKNIQPSGRPAGVPSYSGASPNAVGILSGGQPGSYSLFLGNTFSLGIGAPGLYGGGAANWNANQANTPARGPGAGGCGTLSGNPGVPYPGSAGGYGYILIEERS